MLVNPIVFLHVPKTAGTSFRKGVDSVLGDEQCCRDYGRNSVETSGIVRSYVLDDFDLWSFKRAFDSTGYRFLTGHIGALKYVPIFGVESMVSFVRDPVQRIMSEFSHFRRHYGYSHNFETFYRSPQFINRQKRTFDGLAWPAIAFIGLTEAYGQSLRLIHKRTGLSVPSLDANKGRPNLEVDYKLSSEQEAEIRKLNAADIRFYEAVKQQFEWRCELAESGGEFVSGMVTNIGPNGKVIGWAVSESAVDPVCVRILVNGVEQGEILAKEDRPNLREKGLRRAGLVGFSLPLAVKSGDEIRCEVAETGQPLVNSPWIVE